jgi:hypothetical protein
VHSDPDLFRTRDQAWNCLAEFAVVRNPVGHDGAATPAQIDEPLVPQQLVRAKRGVDVDIERIGDVSRRWQSIAGSQIASARLGPHGGGQLLEQWDRACRVDSEEHEFIILFYLH